MIELNYSTVEDREQHKDVEKHNFESKDLLLSFIKSKYIIDYDNKPVVFVVMVNRSEFKDESDNKGYFISSSFNEVLDYLFKKLKDNYFDIVTLFEEYTYSNAFNYCKDHCEVHELGLENKFFK